MPRVTGRRWLRLTGSCGAIISKYLLWRMAAGAGAWGTAPRRGTFAQKSAGEKPLPPQLHWLSAGGDAGGKGHRTDKAALHHLRTFGSWMLSQQVSSPDLVKLHT